MIEDGCEMMRREYTQGELTEAMAGDDPLLFFARWFDEAIASCPGAFYEPNTMALATVDARGVPANRIVLLKAVEDGQFIFYTNYQSAKAAQMAVHPHVALAMHWPWLERQVRVVGTASRVDRATSEAYFATRPRGSQLGAWVSNQSDPMTREQLDDRLEELQRRFGDGPIACPPHWGGYAVRPSEIEFWQGRSNRLHDRLHFGRADHGSPWQRKRLGP